jgi:hypothetical protein
VEQAARLSPMPATSATAVTFRCFGTDICLPFGNENSMIGCRDRDDAHRGDACCGIWGL